MGTSLLETDVCIYGAGMGGVAAALTLLEQGYRVVVFEPSMWIGGQMTSQGVSALDEHEYMEEHPGTARYGALRDAIRGTWFQARRVWRRARRGCGDWICPKA